MAAVRRLGLLLTVTGVAFVMVGLAADGWYQARTISRPLVLLGGAAAVLGVAGLIVGVGRDRDAGAMRLPIVGAGLLTLAGAAGVGSWIVTGGNLGARGPGFLMAHEGGFELRQSADGLWETRMLHGEPTVEVSGYEVGSDPTTSQLAAATDLVHRTREAAVRWSDYDAARESGFTVSNLEILGRDSRFMHLFHPANMSDGMTLDPEAPESLVYFMRSASPRLVGVMYMAPLGKHGPQVGGPLTRWHYHPSVEFCMDEVGVPTVRAENGNRGGCPEGEANGPTNEMMHVWLADNPWGVFSHRMELTDADGEVFDSHEHEP